MASIQKLPSGKWKATVYVGRDANGKMIRKSVTKGTKKECKDAARELEQKVSDNDISNIGNMRMSAYMSKWLDLNKADLASTTIKAYRLYIDTHFIPFFGDYKVEKVTEFLVKEYLSKKLEYLSSCTVRKHFFTLSKIMYDALKGKSPCIDIKAPKGSTYIPRVPTTEEFKLIWDVFKHMGPENELIILLAGWCGMRRGEIFALKQDDIVRENCTITIDEAVALEEEGYEFKYKEPKSENGIRTIVAPEYIFDLIDTVLKRRKVIKPEIISYDPHYFTQKFGKTIKDENYGLPKVRFHDLRHYHATFLYENDIPDHYAAKRLGHDILVLKKIYQHLGLKKEKECDEKIMKILGNKK